MSRTFWDPVDPAAPGSLDPRLHARVNGEIYRFARTTTLRRFQRDPVRWCGILRDPVSGVRLVPDRTSPRLEHEGVPYFFESDSTRQVFRHQPSRFAIRRRD